MASGALIRALETHPTRGMNVNMPCGSPAQPTLLFSNQHPERTSTRGLHHPQGGLIPSWPLGVQLPFRYPLRITESDVHSRQQDEEGTRAKKCTCHWTHGPG